MLGRGWLFLRRWRCASRSGPSRRLLDPGSVMSGRTLNVELHCHTCHSMDGVMTFDSLVAAATRVGLDAVAITDHDTITGAREFMRLAKDRGVPLQIIPGEERTLADGSHFIGLFLHEPIASRDLAGAIGEVADQGGLCLVPHPF